MPVEITMPKLSDTMEEGTILRWYKHEGDRVEPGEVLAEVETDKADMELEADKSGVVSEIRVKAGQAAPVGAVLAILGEGETAQPSAKPPAAKTAAKAEKKTEEGTEEDTEEKAEAPAAPRPRSVPPPPPPKPGAAPMATPTARPSATRPAAAPLPPAPPAAGPPPATKWTPRPGKTPPAGPPPAGLSKLRQAVAKQMTASKREVPHFYVTSEVDMSEAARMRAALTGVVAEHITFTHLLIRALALTLPRHARMNASWLDEAIVYHDDVNIGIAVAV